ncbi:hypothetical protein LAJ19_07635 [Deinococcus taeanensis]|uniref:hypothetical protein n=1 Tax=Deinococcus taeanensis TaxID=2737050 RepID=UPI001CDBB0FE|nr:hypothetical protein [Deinococcus taeanensis]UBV41538.1 hypothetical protein LAJ19_07635 [Deinococcus taeanensis]
MRSLLRPVQFAPFLLSAPLLGSCAWGAYFPPVTALEQQVNGVYEGVGVGPTGRVPYRLALSVVERDGRVSGSLVNLESRKTYAGNGTFKRLQDGTELTMNLYENGAARANLYLVHREHDGQARLDGHLRTVLLGREALGYTLTLHPTQGAGTP